MPLPLLRDILESAYQRRTPQPEADLWNLIITEVEPFKQTAAELAVPVAPVNYSYLPGHLYRYGTNTTPGTTDMTTALANALAVQQDVFIPAEIVKTTAAVTMLSNQTLYGLGPESQIACAGSNTSAVRIVGKTRSIVRDLFVKYTGTSAGGSDGAAVIITGGASFCTVTRCRLEGARAGVTVTSGNDNVIDDNDITNVTLSGTLTEASWDISVYLEGSRNRITRNRCFGGSGTGVQVLSDLLKSCDRNIIDSNHISAHTQYGITVYANTPTGTTNNNVVTNNNIWDISGTLLSGGTQPFGAGIYVASAEWTTVVGNVLENTNISTNTTTLAPAAIGVLGTSCFVVMGNVIKSPKWHGIYVVTDGNGLGAGLVEGNTITAPVKTAITVVEMTNVSVIGNGMMGGTTDNAIRVDHSGTATGISVQNNKIRNFAAGNGIAINHAQCPNVSGNYVHSASIGINLVNTNGAIICGNEVRNSSGTTDVFVDSTCSGVLHFDRNTVRSAAANGVNDQAGLTYGYNDVAGQTSPFTGITIERVLATSATPSVLGSRQAAYGAATAVTDLLNPTVGQILTIRASGACTFQHNTGAATTKLILQGAANFVMAANNTLTLEYVPGGPWYEVARKT